MVQGHEVPGTKEVERFFEVVDRFENEQPKDLEPNEGNSLSVNTLSVMSVDGFQESQPH